MQLLVHLAGLLLPEHCAETLFGRFDIFDGPCLQLLISKGLGMAVVAGACIGMWSARPRIHFLQHAHPLSLSLHMFSWCQSVSYFPYFLVSFSLLSFCFYIHIFFCLFFSSSQFWLCLFPSPYIFHLMPLLYFLSAAGTACKQLCCPLS